jgi:hypothetical protein
MRLSTSGWYEPQRPKGAKGANQSSVQESAAAQAPTMSATAGASHDSHCQFAKPLQSDTALWRSTGHNGGPHLAMALKDGIILVV